MTRAHDPGELLTHPVTLVALAAWALNDHLFKTTWPSWVTGKLSDVACLIVLPALATGIVELIRHWRGQPRRADGWLVLTAVGAGLVMALINLSPLAGRAYELGLGALQLPFRALGASIAGHAMPSYRPVVLTMDPTDLVTLPAVIVPVWLQRRRPAVQATPSRTRVREALVKGI
jgi:hypothetical protein